MLNRELVKGSTVILVLTLLNERPMYGYELVKEMGSRSGNELQMKEGTLYPSLHKLERQGYISSYWEKQEKGPQILPDYRRRQRSAGGTHEGMERIFSHDGPNTEVERTKWIKKHMYPKSKAGLKGFLKTRQ